MKMAVLFHSGPFMNALRSSPILLSPRAIDVPLCCDVPACGPVPGNGIANVRFGRVPACASSISCWAGATFADFGPYRQSPKLGHMDQTFWLLQRYSPS